MKLAPFVLTVGMLAGGHVQAEDVPALLQTYNCRLCHSDYETRTGPAFVDVAAKYRAKKNAASTIVAVIRKGVHGEGPWPMPPLPEVSPADARRMAEYILSLKPLATKAAGTRGS
jgi:cytochrome c